jgi:hypothetical protein
MPPYTITHWDRRNFALYDGEDLLAVTLYKKGATRLKNELTKRDTEIDQRSLSSARSSAPPHAQAPQPNIQLPAP